MQANAPIRNLVQVEDVLCRLARDTHGALSLLGSTSLDCLGGAHIAGDRISDRHDVWRAHVFDAGRLLVAVGEDQTIKDMLKRLLSTIDHLASAYTDLVSAHALPRDAVAELRGRFPAVYRDLQSSFSDLGNVLGIDLSFPRRLNSLRRACFERSLQWLDDELIRYEEGPRDGNQADGCRRN